MTNKGFSLQTHLWRLWLTLKSDCLVLCCYFTVSLEGAAFNICASHMVRLFKTHGEGRAESPLWCLVLLLTPLAQTWESEPGSQEKDPSPCSGFQGVPYPVNRCACWDPQRFRGCLVETHWPWAVELGMTLGEVKVGTLGWLKGEGFRSKHIRHYGNEMEESPVSWKYCVTDLRLCLWMILPFYILFRAVIPWSVFWKGKSCL